MRCEFCGAGFDTRAGLSSHARAHLRDFGITNWELTVSPIHVLARLLARSPGCPLPPFPHWHQDADTDGIGLEEEDGTPLDLWHSQIPKQESGRVVEKMASDQNTGRNDDHKAIDGEPGRDTDCQFCGAWFETRKGLSSHARAHLRHLGVTDPDAKGSPIAALNSLIKSDDFKKRLSAGHVPIEADRHIRTSENSTSTNTGMSINQSRESSTLSKLTEAGTFARMAEESAKTCDGTPVNLTDGNMHSVRAEGGARSFDSTGPAETAVNFKCPSNHVKHVEASAPHALLPAVGGQAKLDKTGNAHVKSEAQSSKKMVELGARASPSGLAHPRPPTSTPPTKRLKASTSASKASMDSYWSSSNSSNPLNLSPGSEEVRCEFCGEFFENRKGLSSHARSHLRQMGVTEWHVNGSPIDTLREILASGTCPRPGTRVGGHSSEKLLSLPSTTSPSGSVPYTGLSQGLQRKPPRLHSYPAGEWPSDLSPLNLSSRADPTRDIRCEFCNEFFENRKGLSSHARSHLRQMGITEWHVNGSPIDTLREIIRKRRPPHIANIKKEPRGDRNPTSPSPTISPLGMGPPGLTREIPTSPIAGRQHNFLPPKRPGPHEPRMSHSDPKGYLHLEPKSYIQGESKPKAYMQEDGRPKSCVQGDGRPKSYVQGDGRPKSYVQGDGRPKSYVQGDGRPKLFTHGEGRPKAYIQTELPFKVKVKASPDKAATNSVEACCELCGLYFENRKALASHARAHLRQFGVTEWCVNGSPIETLREWMKQRPQKAGAYLSYIQGGRPFTKKFKRSSHPPKSGATEKESQAAVPSKSSEADWSPGLSGVGTEKPAEGPAQKNERRHSKPPEVPPSRDDAVAEPPTKHEEQRPPIRARPVPSLVPRPPQSSLVKFVGNIYTLKCRFCDIQFQGPLSIQEQWVRHLQHHILEMNYSKAPPSPPPVIPPTLQPEPAKAV